MKTSAKTRRVLAVLVPAVLVGLLLAVFGLSYAVNDDTTIISVLNGSYTGTPDGHAIFVKYPLSLLIALLYSIVPAVPWYAAALCGSCLFAMSFLLLQLLHRFPDHPIPVCVLFSGGFLLTWAQPFARTTFSTCGAFVSICLAMSYALIPREEDRKPGKLVPLLILLGLSYCLRDYFALASLMFLGLVWLSKYCREMFRSIQCWLIPLLGLAVLGLCIGCNTAAYSSPDWQEFLEYNDIRSNVQDYYGIPLYKQNEDFFRSMGLTPEEQDTLCNYTYFLREDFSPDEFRQISDYVLEHQSHPSLPRQLKNALKTGWHYYILMEKENTGILQVLSVAAPVSLLLAALVLSLRDRKHYWVFPLLVLAGIGALWLYICASGRYPPRVALSLRIISVGAAVLGMFILFQLRPIRIRQKKAVLVVLSLLMGVFSVWHLKCTFADIGHAPIAAKADYTEYAEAHPDNIYLLDTRLTNRSRDEYLAPNMLYTGGWLFYSPLFDQRLERMGLPANGYEILQLPNAYLMTAKNVNLVMGFPENPPLDCDTVDQLGSIGVYHLNNLE